MYGSKIEIISQRNNFNKISPHLSLYIKTLSLNIDNNNIRIIYQKNTIPNAIIIKDLCKIVMNHHHHLQQVLLIHHHKHQHQTNYNS